MTVLQIDGTKIFCKPEEAGSLQKWKSSDSFAYERCIGLYYDGNIDKFLTIDDILYS